MIGRVTISLRREAEGKAKAAAQPILNATTGRDRQNHASQSFSFGNS
jgi:hypothetical protein